jgi:hypothetical protein
MVRGLRPISRAITIALFVRGVLDDAPIDHDQAVRPAPAL